MTKYVVGFAFDVRMSSVVLIQKKRPLWQKDRWNGVGGHVEAGEQALTAMVREFSEETGVHIYAWRNVTQIATIDNEIIIDVFTACSNIVRLVRTTTDEAIRLIHLVDLINYPVIDNLKWLIPMCLSGDRVDRIIIPRKE